MGCDSDRRNYRVTGTKIRRVLGFMPRWTLEQGVEQVIGAIREGKVRDYRDARYSNVKFLGEEGLRLLATQKNWAWELINETAARPPLPVEQAA